MQEITIGEIEAAAAMIAPVARRTPVLEAGEISRRIGARVTLKAECLQATGSFKVRGAYNAIAHLTKPELRAGVVAASAGNHAQAVAAAASQAGVRADLFMPSVAPLAKVAAVKRRGGKVHLVPGSFEDANHGAQAFAAKRGAALVPPFDHPAVIAGQGTVGLEIAEQAPGTSVVVVPVGGGALAAGIAIAMKARLSGTRVIGVRAEDRSAATICDGIAVKGRGELTEPLLERWVDELVTVTDDQVAEAMVLLLERSKLVVEGAGAAGAGALLAGRVKTSPSDHVCVVLSGGNVDATRLAECIAMGETAAGRRVVVSVVMPDRPGALANLLGVVANQGANVVDVEHLREGLDLHIGETGITLILQTKGPDHSAELLAAIEAEGFAGRPRPFGS